MLPEHSTINPLTRRPSLLQQLAGRNPYMRGTAYGPGFASTADMFNGMSWTNDQLDRAQFSEEDRLRKLHSSPFVINQKKVILKQAGYPDAEADELSKDPDFWRPEWERFGIKRPYNINPIFAGTVTPEQQRRENIDQGLEEQDYIADRRLEGDIKRDKRKLDSSIEQERQIRAQFPEDDGDYFSTRGRRSSGLGVGGGSRSTSRAGGKKETNPIQDVVTGVNRESILNTGKPAYPAPVNRLDPGRQYIGENVSHAMADLDAQESAAQSYMDKVERDAAPIEKELSDLESLDILKPEQAKRLEELQATMDELGRNHTEAKKRLKDVATKRKAVSGRLKDYGLEATDTGTVFDPERGRVYKFTPPVLGPPMPLSKDDIERKDYFRRAATANPRQRRDIDLEVQRLAKAGIIDEESDLEDPNGARAQITRNVLAGQPATSTPTVDPATGRLTITPRPSADYRIQVMRNKAAEIAHEAALLLEDNPDMTQDEAVAEASKNIYNGNRRALTVR